MSELVSLTSDCEIGVITVNNPPVNALSPGVPEGIARRRAAQNDDAIKAIVLIGAAGRSSPARTSKSSARSRRARRVVVPVFCH